MSSLDGTVSSTVSPIFPEEIWDRIIGFFRADAMQALIDYMDQSEDKSFLQLLTLNRAWARLAIPHLYRVIFFPTMDEIHRLRKLSTVLLRTPVDHPRRTWVQELHIFMDVVEEGEDLDMVSADVSSMLTTVITRSHIHVLCLDGVPLQEGAISALEAMHRKHLFNLEMTMFPENVGAMASIAFMGALTCLKLEFLDDDWDEDVLEQLPPLLLPNIIDLTWDWVSADLVTSALKYLAQCRFHDTCTFNISYNGDDPDYGVLLDPFFLAHHSLSVTLHCGIPVDSKVFRNSQVVHFRNCLPEVDPDLFINSRLSPFILFSQIESGYGHVWEIFEKLLHSPHIHKSGIAFRIPFSDLDIGLDRCFKWADALDPNHSPKNTSVRNINKKFIHYNALLSAKGIIIYDATGNTSTGHHGGPSGEAPFLSFKEAAKAAHFT